MQKLWTRVIGAAVVVAAFSLPAQAAFQLQSWIGLQGAPGDHRCVQPEGGTSAWNGSVIKLQTCDPYDSSSLWEEEFLDEEWIDGVLLYWKVQFRNVGTGLCLDVKDGNLANGTPLQLWECNGSSSMLWVIDPNHDDKQLLTWRSWRAYWDAGPFSYPPITCMDVRGGSWLPGTPVQNYRWSHLPDGSANYAQWWRYLQR